ncbi:MAG: cell wall-binding repeat-containing protein [Vagococcus sp.]|nr:cell wall-binding repeat-containing protein [Vagococcus sp.]
MPQSGETKVGIDVPIYSGAAKINKDSVIIYEREDKTLVEFKSVESTSKPGVYFFLINPDQKGLWKAVEFDGMPIDDPSFNLQAFNNEDELYEYFNLIPPSHKLRNSRTVMNVYRYQGSNRYTTASTVSKANFSSANNVVLINANNYTDGLAAVNLASRLKAPILYTNGKSLDSSTKTEINRLGASKIYVIGGPNSIESSVITTLRNINSVNTVTRVYGSSRTETAIEIAKKARAYKTTKTAILVSGLSYPDALSAGPLSGQNAYPIMYSVSSSLDSATRNYIRDNFTNIIIVGGDNSVSSSIERDLKVNLRLNVTRISGNNRYETSQKFANKYYTSPSSVYFAAGTNYVDALMGGVVAAKNLAPIILVEGNTVNNELKNYIISKSITYSYIFGGTNSISSSFESSLKSIYNENTARTKIVAAAKKELGKPYVWGASGPDAYDCSGLVQTLYKKVLGISLYRVTSSQVTQGREVTWDEMKPGDLMFFKADDYNPQDVSHVAIYIGDGKMIHAKNEDTGVVTDSIYSEWWYSRLCNIRNVID